MRDQVIPHADWRKQPLHRLDGLRFIAQTHSGQTLDGHLAYQPLRLDDHDAYRPPRLTDRDGLMTVIIPNHAGRPAIAPGLRSLVVLDGRD